MEQLRGFLLSLMSASAAGVLAEGLIPDGEHTAGFKKHIERLISLILLLILLSPLKSVLQSLSSYVGNPADETAAAFAVQDDDGMTECISRVNSLLAIHIRRAVCVKFHLPEDDVSVEVNGQTAVLTVKKHFGILAADLSDFTDTAYGITSTVIFYE